MQAPLQQQTVGGVSLAGGMQADRPVPVPYPQARRFVPLLAVGILERDLEHQRRPRRVGYRRSPRAPAARLERVANRQRPLASQIGHDLRKAPSHSRTPGSPAAVPLPVTRTGNGAMAPNLPDDSAVPSSRWTLIATSADDKPCRPASTHPATHSTPPWTDYARLLVCQA